MKSRYLSELKESEFSQLTFSVASRNIAKTIGSSSSYIRRLLTSYELYKLVEDVDFYSIDNLNDTSFHLNYFTDSLNKENVRTFLGINITSDKPLENLKSENLEKIVYWWFKETEGQSRLLGDSKSFKMLDKVLNHTTAFEAFEKGASISQAYELTNDIDQLFEKAVKKSLKELEQADNYSNKVNIFYTGLFNDLKLIRDIALKIKNFQQQKENNDDF